MSHFAVKGGVTLNLGFFMRLTSSAAVFITAGLAFAQQPEPLMLGPVTVSGSFRSRFEIWDFFHGDANYNYPYSGNQLRVNFSQSLKRFDWQVEMEVPFLLGVPDDAIAPAPQLQLGLGGNYYGANSNSRYAAMVFAKQGFVRFRNFFGDKDQTLRVGRFEWMDGAEAVPRDATLSALKRDRVNQRLIGPFAWSHVGRSFDGFHYSANKGRINYTMIAALPTWGAFQVNGWGDLRVGFGYLSATGQTGSERSAGEWRILGIYYQDWRHLVKTDNRPLAARQADLNNIRIGTYGGHYMHKLDTTAGALNFLAWGVLQNGAWGRQDHSAGAMNLEAGWQPKVMPKLKPWLMGGYSRTSGDGNPSDNKHNTFFQVLPTPRPYARTPFHNMMNNEDFFGILALRPHKAVTVRAEFHALRNTNRNDLWYVGGGAFQPSTFGYIGRNTSGAQSLANLWDTSIDWNVNARLSVNGYYGFADGKSAMHVIYPKGPSAQFGYIEFIYRF